MSIDPSIEVRSITREELTDFRRITGYAFADNESDPADESNQLVAPEWTTCAFVDGRLASILAAYPFRVRFNGRATDAAGLTAVATLPSHRRRGLLRATMLQSLREQRERGQSIAILWASFGGIYQRFGYGIATNWLGYTVDPRWVRFHPGLESKGSTRLIADRGEALGTIEPIYRQYAKPRNLLIHRAPASWNFGVFRDFDKKHRTHCAVYQDADGTPTGYVVYQTESVDRATPNQRLTVRDFIALDLDAHVGLWRYLIAHDLVFEIVMDAVAEDDPTPLLIEEPRKLERKLSDGLYLRVVDAERAFAERAYACRDRLALEIRQDAACDWNEGVFELDAGPEGVEVTRKAATPDLTLPPRALATLLCGHSSATALFRAGSLDARDPNVLARADRLFATAHRPTCPDGF